IECDDRYCKFSKKHPQYCGVDCVKTCWQYRQFPQQYGKGPCPALCCWKIVSVVAYLGADVTHEGSCAKCTEQEESGT
ncbi:hypothetical protein P691DRAFT_664039, partial [Macrolepiota fuliginosa MF-IS2]